MDTLEEMDKLLDIFYLPRLNSEDIENLNRLVMYKEIESVIKTPSNFITTCRETMRTT